MGMYFRINFDMDLTKIDKSRIRESEKGGKYATFTLWCDTDKVRDEYGNSGYVSQSWNSEDYKKKERDGTPLPDMPILGDAKVVYPKYDVVEEKPKEPEPKKSKPTESVQTPFDDDIPW